jgi:hypothetical protein
VQIDYRPLRPPRIRVLDQLETRPGESLPHTYNTGTLCLYEPDEWTDSMYLADTIVPWTTEWLINYEIWLATGDWHGGGEWPPRRGVPEKRVDEEAKELPGAAA